MLRSGTSTNLSTLNSATRIPLTMHARCKYDGMKSQLSSFNLLGKRLVYGNHQMILCLEFRIGYRQFIQIWKKVSKATGFKITPQVLRKWHSTMLGELMVPDRFVDVFQGRAPRGVLAKHYTGKGLERLKRIYEKANLTLF